MNRRLFSSAFLIAIMVGGLVLFGDVRFGTVKASTSFSGIISANTTWTQADSPYSLTGPMLVNNGVTLSIEPGVTIYFNEFYLKVDGTLNARGSSSNKIFFVSTGTSLSKKLELLDNGLIGFSSQSSSWHEQANSGCIIENAIIITDRTISTVGISGASPKINNCTIINMGQQRAIIIQGGAPIISNNFISSTNEGITLAGVNNASILDNVIKDCEVGIEIYGGTPIIQRNLIANNTGNKINGYGGIRIDYPGTNPIIRDNTIIKNSVGFNLLNSPNPTIINNNIHDNNEYNIYLYGSSSSNAKANITATYNWWGTTDIPTINQTFYDFKRDFNLGTVTFVPFLTEPNSHAPDVSILPSTSPTPIPSTLPTNSSTPTTIQVPGQSFFFINSNSTVSALFFNSTSSELSFTVNGTSGTAGYVKVTIAKSLVASVQNVKVYLDGSQLDVAITSNADSWLLEFTYMHSEHQVKINLAANAVEGPFLGNDHWIWVAIAFTICVMLIVVVAFRRRRSTGFQRTKLVAQVTSSTLRHDR